MRKRLLTAVPVALRAALAARPAHAQSNEGALAGTITDPGGSVVPGATVTAENTANGQSFKTNSSAAGDYRFPVLLIGVYNVTATAPGFKGAEKTGVAIQIQSTTSLDIQLAVGASTETVQVSANAPQLQTESADVGTVVTPRQVLDLPLSTNGSAIRNSQDFVFLTPATYGTGTNGGTFEGGVSGGQAFGSEILFDGASLQVESFGDGFANEILPSVEATGEFKVLVGGIPAQYGRTTGGVQSYASKSGTNSFHGGAFELFRNTDLDANTWFNNLSRAQNGHNAGNATPADKKNNYGVLLGGPVWIPKVYDGRNKTFFFFAWEQFRQNQGYQGLITIPTPANLAGDFSQDLTTTALGTNPCDGSTVYQGQIFDPTTTRTLADGTQCRTAYPGNVIPSGLSAVSKAIAAYGENRGQLSYNAMIAKLERRFHNGLNLLASYTWSKILTDTGNIIGGSLGGAYTSNVQNPFNLKAEKAVSPEDTPQIFVLSYLYDLPFGRDKAFLSHSRPLNYFVGGWSITGIQRYRSGQPIGFSCATGVPGFSNCIRWDLVPGQPIQSSARQNKSFNPAVAGQNLWYNRSAFVDPNADVSAASGLPYRFGDKPAYQGNDRSFPYYEEDFGLIKRTPITEGVDLQFRAEFFNAFNRHVFSGPDTNPYDSGFGTVGGLNNSPRAGQLTLRLEF